MRAAEPEMLVCTIWRSVCPLKVVPLLCGETAQVPVQVGARGTATLARSLDGPGGFGAPVEHAKHVMAIKTAARRVMVSDLQLHRCRGARETVHGRSVRPGNVH